MKTLLTLKHWQIFSLWLLSGIIFQKTIHTHYWFISTIIYGLIMIGWIYSIGKVLSKIDKRNNNKKQHEDIWFGFAISLFILLVYFSRSASLRSSMMYFSISIFQVFCTFKLVNFSAKTLKQNEENRNLKFTDYFGEFILIGSLLFGFLIIQPKLNKIINAKSKQTPNT